MIKVTAKIKCVSKTPVESGEDDQFTLAFSPDYTDDRNRAWAKFTPSLSLSMVVKGSVSQHFEPGAAYVLTFTPEQMEDKS